MTPDERAKLVALADEWAARAEEIREALDLHIVKQRAEETTWRRAAMALRRVLPPAEEAP